MPQRGPKPSEVAVEAKRYYIPRVEQVFPELPPKSYAFPEVEKCHQVPPKFPKRPTRIAVLDGDAVDVALKWNFEAQRYEAQNLDRTIPQSRLKIPLLVAVDEKRAGGDWETASMGAEESLSRRSNFVRCLARSQTLQKETSPYPIPSRGGIYSPQVVVFRSGTRDTYSVWETPKWSWLPVISVAPGRRPKLNNTGKEYTFAQERDLMGEKIRTALRLALTWGHREIIVGPFGFGPGFRNPSKQLSTMWKTILFEEEEFRDRFHDVVFAIEHESDNSRSGLAGPSSAAASANHRHNQTPGLALSGLGFPDAESSSGSSAGSTPESTGSYLDTGLLSDFEIFKDEFDPSNICKVSCLSSS